MYQRFTFFLPALKFLRQHHIFISLSMSKGKCYRPAERQSSHLIFDKFDIQILAFLTFNTNKFFLIFIHFIHKAQQISLYVSNLSEGYHPTQMYQGFTIALPALKFLRQYHIFISLFVFKGRCYRPATKWYGAKIFILFFISKILLRWNLVSNVSNREVAPPCLSVLIRFCLCGCFFGGNAATVKNRYQI